MIGLYVKCSPEGQKTLFVFNYNKLDLIKPYQVKIQKEHL